MSRSQLGRATREIGNRRRQLPGRRAVTPLIIGGQQALQQIRRDLQRPGQPGPDRRQRLALAAFPPHHRGTPDGQHLGQRFLRQPQRLAALDQALPSGRGPCDASPVDPEFKKI